MLIEQRIRAFLFYLSVLVFFTGLPFILSSALGYKFNRHTFKFTKTGLIVIKTQPAGASIYLDRQLLNDRTPATLNEIMPGVYNLRIEMENFYPWYDEVNVDEGKVTRLEKIILFPLRPNIQQLNKERISDFWIDQDKGVIYYVDREENIVYRSDLSGDNYEELSEIIPITPAPIGWKISPDREKLLYFNERQIGLVPLQPYKQTVPMQLPFVLDYPSGKIKDLFWHSDSYHIIIVGNKDIEVLEARPKSSPTILVNLTKKNTFAFYDLRTDTLYFSDYQQASDGNLYNNLYKLELNARNFPLQGLIKLKPSE
ncbi:MAG: PEGA domain-containing protein [Candidatus Omnitrophica bacterium]|nr:PEGA domain-containing protein [Candidatus Omnitrophota bacterium]